MRISQFIYVEYVNHIAMCSRTPRRMRLHVVAAQRPLVASELALQLLQHSRLVHLEALRQPPGAAPHGAVDRHRYI